MIFLVFESGDGGSFHDLDNVYSLYKLSLYVETHGIGGISYPPVYIIPYELADLCILRVMRKGMYSKWFGRSLGQQSSVTIVLSFVSGNTPSPIWVIDLLQTTMVCGREVTI